VECAIGRRAQVVRSAIAPYRRLAKRAKFCASSFRAAASFTS
jgi:hypothetical protein